MRYQIITYLTVKSPPQAKIFRNPGYFSEKITSEVITMGAPPLFQVTPPLLVTPPFLGPSATPPF